MALTTITGSRGGGVSVAARDTLLIAATGVLAADGALRGIAMRSDAVLVNRGFILAEAVGGAGTVPSTVPSTGQTVTNFGTIISTGAHAMSWAHPQATEVTLLKFGEIAATGAAKSAISLGAGGNSLINYGSLTSAMGVAIDVLSAATNRGNTVTNTGLIGTGHVAGAAIDLDAGNDVVVNTGSIVGNIRLRAGADVYDGRGGLISGSVQGGAGADIYRLDDAATHVLELAGGGTDTVEISMDYVLGAEVERLRLTGNATLGVGNDAGNLLTGNGRDNVLLGRLGNDTLRGLGGDDVLRGSDGEDVLTGGKGEDVMCGGAGDDRFVFESAFDSLLSGNDTIASFRRGSDRIDLSVLDGNTGVAGNQNFAFRGTAEFTAAGQVRIVDDGVNLRAEINVDSDGGAELEISSRRSAR